MKFLSLVFLAALFILPAQAHTYDGTAELPRVVFSTGPASTPTPGAVTFVPAGANLQLAINNAQCGDILQLQAGATFTGVFTFPAKNCVGTYVQVRTSSPDNVNGMPGVGARITPCRAGIKSLPGRPAYGCANPQPLMAKIIAPKGVGPIVWANGASNYRLGPGLEITRTVGTGVSYNLIAPAGAANHIVIDRNWIHGTTHDDTTRGILLSGMTYVGIVNNYMTDFHCTAGIGTCVDAQDIAGGNGPLPQGIWRISNNFLEASTENILFGGTIKNSVTPADIQIVNNHMFKPLIWMPGQPGYVGGFETATLKCPRWDTTGTIGQCPFVVKNLFELKNAQRLLLEGNVLEYNWPGFSQHGGSILLSGLNPPAPVGSPVYSTVSLADITIRYNRVAHTTGGFGVVNMGMENDGGTSAGANLPVRNVNIHDNVFDDMGPQYFIPGQPADLYNFLSMLSVSSSPIGVPLSGVSITHNTIIAVAPKTGFILGTNGTQTEDFTFANNIMSTPPGLVVTGGGSSGCSFTGPTDLSRINACLVPNYVFAGNVMIGATNTWPSGNYFPANAASVQFVNYNGGVKGDYHLSPVSPYFAVGTDGLPPGANIDLVNSKTKWSY